MVDQSLLDSIKQYLDQGVSSDSIKQSLVQSGWSEKDVNKALEKITGQRVKEKKEEVQKEPVDKRKILLIAGGIVILLLIASLIYFFVIKVGFSEDIPDDLIPGNLNKFIKERLEGYNKLSLASKSPLKEVIQNGRVNMIMTNNMGTEIIDAIGLTVKDSQIISTDIKVDDPSFDIKFTEETFNEVTTSSDPESLFLTKYAKGKVKIKSYGKENKAKLDQLNRFVEYFFVL